MGIDRREFQGDFDTTSRILGNRGSVDALPDAFAADPLVAYAMGPIALGDVSEGIYTRVWYVRVDNVAKNVLVAVANSGNTAFGSESILFSFTGVVLDDVDIAFDQSGRANVSAGRSTGGGGESHIWLYWYDPLVPDFIFADFGEGRNPRVIMDVPEDPVVSDVMMFYMDDPNNELRYRQQRDRFAIPISSNFSGVTNYKLVELARTTDNRLRAVLTQHVPFTGQYSLTNVETTLLPFSPDAEALVLGALFISGDNATVVLVPGQGNIEEAIDLGVAFQSGVMTEPQIVIDPQNSQGSGVSPEEAVELGVEFQSGFIVIIVIVAEPGGTWFEVTPEAVELGTEFQSGAIDDIVLDATIDPEGMQLGTEFQSGTLVVP